MKIKSLLTYHHETPQEKIKAQKTRIKVIKIQETSTYMVCIMDENAHGGIYQLRDYFHCDYRGHFTY